MDRFSAQTAAERSGSALDEVIRLTEIGILSGDGSDGYTDADVRRIQVARSLGQAGLSIDDLGSLVREGKISLEFIDDAGYRVFSALSNVTFDELGRRTGIPVEQLILLRDVTGGRVAAPDDLVREDELEILPLIEYQLEIGFRWSAVERALRVYAESLRRIAEGEAEWWRSEVQEPLQSRGAPARELAQRAGEISPRLSRASDRAVMAVYHAQQMQVWSTNIVNGFAIALEQAGLHEREVVHPAMCFLDVTGYTQLTAEHGDAAAAALAERLGGIVRPISVAHGGRPVKWLGDGVMFHFPGPADGAIAAVEMVERLEAAGMPAAHVGLHAGPIVIQQGDYFGGTVNAAARIGEYARPGEVLVSQPIVDAVAGELEFEPIGAIGLKGLPAMELYVARKIPTPES
jgi:class 3 adenylate cyclase